MIDFSNVMRCGSQFIIICESKQFGIIGYIHYRFCWFRQKVENHLNFDSMGSSNYITHPRGKKNMAERILFIQNVQTKKDSQVIEEQISNLILMALALEHARQSVVYGVMDTLDSSISFFKTYFRMEEIAKDNSQKGSVFLAIDLAKCNYRFALFLKKDVDGRKKGEAEDSDDMHERMLVSLPSMQKDSLVSRGSVENCSLFRVDTRKLNQQSHIEGSSSGILIGVKINKSDGIILSQVSKTDNSKAKKKKFTEQPEVELDLTKRDWKFLRSFQISSTKAPEEQSADDNVTSLTVQSELAELHEELTETESKFLPSLWSLLQYSYEERKNYELASKQRSQQKQVLKQYNNLLQRRLEEQKAMERLQEQEENAVCDICYDGESTGENRIIFCDSCDISVHQGCYGIEKVPSGDWFCHACLYFKKDQETKPKDDKITENKMQKKQKSSHLPIVCEICPRRQGAFIQSWVRNADPKKRGFSPNWVHVVCAKWHGLGFVDTSTGDEIPYGNIVDDVTQLKEFHKENDHQCCLCKGKRGCYVKCKDCDEWMHITCARSSGLCNFTHGSNHLGEVDSEQVWTVTCPKHSSFDDPDHNPAGTDHLVSLAKKFKSEPKPPPPPPPPPPPKPPKPFYKMTRKERARHLKDPKFEEELVEMLKKKINSRRCEICFHPSNDREEGLVKCNECGSVAHVHCLTQQWKTERPRNKAPVTTCIRCMWKMEEKEKDDFIEPKCHMCNSNVGSLVKAVATPTSMKKWKFNQAGFKRSYFGHQIWVHPICGM